MQKMLSNHGASASKPLGAAGEAVGAAERKWRACSKCLAWSVIWHLLLFFLLATASFFEKKTVGFLPRKLARTLLDSRNSRPFFF